MQAGRPFFTDLQRVAWRARVGASSGLDAAAQPGRDRARAWRCSQRYFDVGGIARVGAPGRLGLFGLSLTGDDEEPGNRLVAAESGVVRDIGPVPTALHVAPASRG